jgi:sugar lactone lactonase YvrE
MKMPGGPALVLAAILALVGSSGTAEAEWDLTLEFANYLAVGIAVDSSGNVYLADGAHDRIQVFSAEGDYLREKAGFLDLRDVAIDEDNIVYALGACRVWRYTTEFQPLGSWDTCIGQGDIQSARGIDVHGGLVYIVTTTSVLKFTTDGALLEQFPFGWHDVHIVPDGSLWVVTPLGAQGLVRHYSAEGVVLGEWATILPDEGSSSPLGIDVDSRGRVFISDGRVKIFQADGALDELISLPFRLLTTLELDGDNVLYVGAGFPDRALQFRQRVVPVDRATWGGIKSQFH